MRGMFNCFWKWVVPLIARNAVLLLKKAGKAVGKEALGSGVNIAKDTLVGRPQKETLKETLKENANSAIDNLKVNAENALKGKGIKRRRSMKKMIILKNVIIKEENLTIFLTMQIMYL